MIPLPNIANITMKKRLPVVLIGLVTAVLGANASAAPQPAHPAEPKARLAAPPKAAPFSLHDVRLLPGPFKDGQDIAVRYLLSLEPDRFLANFRKEAGLPPKAKHYGGWESQGVSGHAGGHYLSACALAYASTGDERFLERVNYFVAELAECQRANGNGYVSAIPNGKKIYAELAAGNIRSAGFDLNGGWVPNYTQHKVMAGLRDAYRLAGNVKALEAEKGLANWFETTLAKLDDAQMQKILVCEHGGMNEVFADLYADTGDARYLNLSRRFHHKAILDPLARGEDILPGKHANTQIPKLIGLASRYEIGGDGSDRAAANFFWDRVVRHHSYVTGGHCDHEHFGQPDRLNDRLSPMTTETCNVYNMLKLTRHVFGWNPDPEVADFHERALLNQIRATQHPDGSVIYNLSLQPGHHKEYQSLYDGFTCCVGTGMENHVKYGEGIYFHDEAGLWVNLYLASELRWKARGLTLRQETGWPDGDTAVFTFTCDQPQELEVRLRHPHWATQGFVLTVNAQPCPVASRPSAYVPVKRRWQTGDRLAVRLPMSLRTEAMPDNPKRIAIFYGPTLLAAELGAVDDPEAGKPFYVPVLVADGKPVTEWVKPISLATQRFKTDGVGKPREVHLVPLHRLHDRRYTVYLDVFSQDGWAKREASLRAEQEREGLLAARTVDILRIGEMQPERDHNLRGEKTSAGEAMGRKWRHAVDGGWFAFEMRVAKDQANELLCTYWGGETGRRTFDIVVDGAKVATQTLLNDRPGQFFEVAYALGEEFAKGKDRVTVKFQAHPGHWAGGLFGARILRRQ
jgi:uncharacterized protein